MTSIHPDNDANNFEAALKQALRPQDPPSGFADRVLARTAQESVQPVRRSRNPWRGIFAQPLLRWTAFAAITASLILGFVQQRKANREHAEGEAAKQRLMLALRIAGSKLQLARAKVNQTNYESQQNQQQEKE
jgi:hypothetical protein